MNTVKTSFRPTILSQSIAAILLCGSLLAPAAHAARVDIPAGSLDHAIQLLAQQTGIVIAADGQQTRQLKVPAIRGELSASQALQQLLSGSTLEAIQQKDGSYLLRPLTELPKVKVSATAPAETGNRTVADGVNEALLETVRVSAAANLGGSETTATSPVKGYVAKRSATATKTDTPIVETPQSVSVVGAAEIKAIGAKTILEALSYTPGVSNNGGFNPGISNFVMRGFSQGGGVLRDGLTIASEMSGFQETYGLERVEYLKGAASVLYGAQSPGGVINTVSKRPSKDMVQEVSAQLDNYSLGHVAADLGGSLDEDGKLLWRLTTLARDGETHIKDSTNERIYIAPALAWQVSDKTQINLQAIYQKDTRQTVGGLPYKGTIQPNPNGQFSPYLNTGEPGQDGNLEKTLGLTMDFSHEFSPTLRTVGALRIGQYDANVNLTGVAALNDDLRTAQRWGARNYATTDKSNAGDVRLEAKLGDDSVQHKIIIGADFQEMKSKNNKPGEFWSAWPWNGGDIDLYNPVYGKAPDRSDLSGNFYSEINDRKTSVGLYAQDQISIGTHWRVLLGGRYGSLAQENKLTGSSQRNSKFSANAGVVYLAENGLAPYASFSQSFQQEIGKLRDGSLMKPTQGEQFEAGLRWQPKDKALMVSVAAYQLTKTNVPKSDPNFPDFQIQAGEVRSRGIELEAKGEFVPNLEGSFGYAYTDARTIQSTTSTEVGKRSAGVPYHQASAWLDYRFAALGLPKLKLGIGVRYLGSKFIDGESFQNPASTQFDARASYDWQNWQYSLNASNLSNERSYSLCGWGTCYPNKARTITGSVAYRF